MLGGVPDLLLVDAVEARRLQRNHPHTTIRGCHMGCLADGIVSIMPCFGMDKLGQEEAESAESWSVATDLGNLLALGRFRCLTGR